ncbi:hypothetical protein [Roseateles sp.]|uniref:hypothetical protein n=1 Tax=Roseateles sp. TaxID=1971397 RepID=UPI0025CFE74D|nr:hypothetical protein [Roseateles sp.]MBV8036348.1 hypothetical protein [Roseateles sp.]
MSSPLFRTALPLFLAAALTACGGGSTTTPAPDSKPDSPPPPPPAGFSFTLDTSKAVVRQGGQATVAVTVQREAGFTDAIQFSADGLPSGATAAALSVAAGSNTGTLTLQAGATAPHSLPTGVTVKGSGGSASKTQPLTVTVRGAAGDIDTSFGGGILITPGGLTDDYVRGVAVQADGKAVVVGYGVFGGGATGTDFMLLRHLRDGGLDTSFGNGGRVGTAFNNGSRSGEALAVAVQPDGKILVAGTSDQGASGYDFALARYNADGTLDASFGTGGRVTTSFGNGDDKAYALLLQPDGKIVLGGGSNQGATGNDFALARYLPNGSLDAGFGNGGKVLTAIGAGGKSETVYALVLQTVAGAARIVAAGGEGDFIAAAYRDDGTLDAGFGTAGLVHGLFGSVTGAARGIVVTADNKLVLAGHRDHHVAAARLLPDGSLDAGFGSGGRSVVVVNADNWDEATALVQQTDGKLLLGGWVYTLGTSADTVLLRLNADGSVDTGFGPGGLRVTPVAAGTKSDAGRALALQHDERVPTVRVLQAGEANGSDLDVVLMRHWL